MKPDSQTIQMPKQDHRTAKVSRLQTHSMAQTKSNPTQKQGSTSDRCNNYLLSFLIVLFNLQRKTGKSQGPQQLFLPQLVATFTKKEQNRLCLYLQNSSGKNHVNLSQRWCTNKPNGHVIKKGWGEVGWKCIIKTTEQIYGLFETSQFLCLQGSLDQRNRRSSASTTPQSLRYVSEGN